MFQGEEMDISEINNSDTSASLYRKSLVPFWIKVFGWFFICFAILVIFGFIMAMLNPETPFSINMFGVFYTGSARNLMPAALVSLISVNAIAGYGLLSGKSWGHAAALSIGYLILVTTLIGKVTYPTNYFPFEPFVVLIYLLVLHKLKRAWQHET